MVFGLVVAYLMLYVSVDPSLARVVPIMAIILVAAAAWLLGFRAGVGAALVAFPTNALLELTWLDLSLFEIYSAPALWLGHGGLLFVGAVFGLLRKGYDNANLQREALSETNMQLDDEIREHRLTVEQLRQAITNLESLVKASPAPIAALDREGRVLVWNPAAERVFRWKASEVIGKDNPIVPAEEEDESLNIWERLIVGESVDGIEVRRMQRDGSRIDLSISTAAWYDADDNVINGRHDRIGRRDWFRAAYSGLTTRRSPLLSLKNGNCRISSPMPLGVITDYR